MKSFTCTRNENQFIFDVGDYLRHQWEILDQLDAEALGLTDE